MEGKAADVVILMVYRTRNALILLSLVSRAL